MLFLSADKASFAAAPAVLSVSVAAMLPPFLQSARSVPEAHGTFHSAWSAGATALFTPWDSPFKNSSTLSQLLYAYTVTMVPVFQFQCGNRCTMGSRVHTLL